MSPAPRVETLHLAAAVIVTRAHCCLTAAGHCDVMLGTIKFVDKSVNDNSAHRLDHCDVIASRSGFGRGGGGGGGGGGGSVCPLVCHTAKLNSKSTHGLNTWRHMHQIQQVSFCPSFSTIHAIVFIQVPRGDNAHWISKNKMAATAVQWELCSMNFRVNIANLWVSCYNGNNDRSARVLFVQHPWEQGEWLSQNPSVTRVLTASFALLPRVMDEQHPRSPVNIP